MDSKDQGRIRRRAPKWPIMARGSVVKQVISVFYPLKVEIAVKASVGVWFSPGLSATIPARLLDALHKKWNRELIVTRCKRDKGIRLEKVVIYPTQAALRKTALSIERDLRKLIRDANLPFGVHISVTPVRTEKEWRQAFG